MKFTLISDLHLEFAPLTLPGGDVLVMAGDVCEVKSIPTVGTMFQTVHTNTSDFFKNEVAKYSRAVYVLGNHEHYGFRFDKTVNEIRERLANIGVNNVTVLENESIEIDGVLIVGATTWTDCNKNDPITMNVLAHSMNDYVEITNKYPGEKYYRLQPHVTYETHKKTIEYFKQVLAQNTSKPTLVVSHHCPTALSIPQKYREDQYMNGGYVSDLSDLILDHPQIKYWAHGHTHDSCDYMVGSTRVICNPRGYSGFENRVDSFAPVEFLIS
jgi:predicted MPP superfamily phosphohydrolase